MNDKKGTVKKEIAIPEKISGEIKEGQKLGELVIKFENEQIGKVDIVTGKQIGRAHV